MASTYCIFDLGRVLVRIARNWQQACERAGIAVITGEFDSTMHGEVMAAVIRAEKGITDIDAFCEELSPHLKLSARDVRIMSDHYLFGLFDGVGRLLDELNASGVVTACLSNTNANHWRIMFETSANTFADLNKLHHRFASHLIGSRKPEPAIYEHVEQALGATPGQILFFDDLPENILTAQLRGWRAFQVPLVDNPLGMIRETLREAGVIQADIRAGDIGAEAR